MCKMNRIKRETGKLCFQNLVRSQMLIEIPLVFDKARQFNFPTLIH